MSKYEYDDIYVDKPLKEIDADYLVYDLNNFKYFKIPEIALNCTFSSPALTNHWDAISAGLAIAERITFLLANSHSETDESGTPLFLINEETNGIYYQYAVELLTEFLKEKGIDSYRFRFKPINWQEADEKTTFLIHQYVDSNTRDMAKIKSLGHRIIHMC